MRGVLLHGGHGTRLRPLTHTGPKQLIKVAGKPVSQWCLEDLRNSGVRDVAIILGDIAPLRVVEYYGDGGWLGLNITYIYQGYPHGLAHAVYCAREFVEDEPFVVYLGDNIIFEGIKRFVEKFENSDAAAQILLAKVPNPQRFGVAKFDKEGRLIGLVEKPKVPPSPYALVGVYFFRPPYIFKAVESIKPSWRKELEITDAIQRLIDWGLRVDYDFITGWWKDTGTPEDILEANRILLDGRISKVIKGRVSENAVIEGRVYIDEGAVIKDDVVVRGPTYIGKNTVIDSETYIGPYTSVGDNCYIRNVELEDSVVMDNVTIKDVNARIVSSIIGAHAVIERKKAYPSGIKFVIGERAKVFI